MTLSDLSIKNPVFAWMLMAGLIVFGWIGFTRLGVSQLPDVDFPVITVTVTLEGAAPEVMETEVTDVIEDAVMSVEGIKEVSSTSKQGMATITLEFNLDRDINLALQDVQSKISQAQKNLPNDIDPPIIMKTNPEDQPVLWLSFSGDRPLKDLMEYTKNHLKDQFTTVPGVGEVLLGGYIEPNLRVWVNEKELQRRELTVDDVLDSIEKQHSEVPAGYIDAGSKEMNVRVMGEANTVAEFEKITITERRGGTPGPIWRTFRIGDVARVEDGLADIRRLSRTRQKPAVGLGIKKLRGANAVEVGNAVKKRMAEVQKFLPPGMQLAVNFDRTKFIKDSIHELNFTLILSALLTALVCYLFLGSWSSTFNVLLAIPTSIIGAFSVLYFMGFTLNTFTLLGLSLAIGIVVDDAIMVLENIVRYREQGMPRVRASLVGAREITFAAMAASFAILAIFVPVVFMKGILGKFFFQYGITMTAAVMLSLLVALSITPMQCSQFLTTGHDTRLGRAVDGLIKRLTSFYRRLLGWCLDHRWTVVLTALAFFIASLSLGKIMHKEFVPAQDQSMMLVRLQTPIGSSLEFTDEVTRKAEAIIAGRGEVERYYAAIGGFGGGEVNTAMMFITMKEPRDRPKTGPKNRPLSQQEFMGVVRTEFTRVPGVMRAIVQDLSLSGFTAARGFPIEFTVRGPDWEKLAEYSETIMKKMAGTGMMVDIDTDYLVGMPEVRVVPNRDKAAARGVNITPIGNAINAMIGGVRAGKYTRDGRRYDIRVRLNEESRSQATDISKIWVRNVHGELIPLSEVVSLREKPSLLSISRKNRERAIGIFSNITPGKSQSVVLSAVEKIGKETLPDGYRLVLSGSAETFKESFESLLLALVLGIFVAYMVLASQFNSFIHPFTVLLALPFSVTGAFIAIVLGHQSLNIYSMIGIILLMGIVKKNSILLVDFTNERRLRGESVHDALLNACPIRLRPILMTSVATIAAAIPPALGFGPGAETRIPMALVVIGGVLLSTLLTLLVVPCAYSLLSRLESHKHDADLREAMTALGESPDKKI